MTSVGNLEDSTFVDDDDLCEMLASIPTDGRTEVEVVASAEAALDRYRSGLINAVPWQQAHSKIRERLSCSARCISLSAMADAALPLDDGYDRLEALPTYTEAEMLAKSRDALKRHLAGAPSYSWDEVKRQYVSRRAPYHTEIST
jgi:hypothetical protein